MRGRNDRRNSKFRSVICVKPEERSDTMIHEIVIAIIAVKLKEELCMVCECETLLGRLLLNFCDPSRDVFGGHGIVEIGVCHGA
jgi:hypothetical protein